MCPKYGRRHLGSQVPRRRFSGLLAVLLLWTISRIAYHIGQLPDLISAPASTNFRPITVDIQDLTCRIPAATLCHGRRALGNPTKPVSIKPGRHTSAIIYTLLILCGDIESNPGPTTETIYPCGICDKKVGWVHRGIACDNCSVWFHCSCVSMKSSLYAKLDSTSEQWKCYRCDFSMSENSLYHSYNIETANSFSVLAGPMFNDSVFSSVSGSPHFQPNSHSSPNPPPLVSQPHTGNSHSSRPARSKSSCGSNLNWSNPSLPGKAKNTSRKS